MGNLAGGSKERVARYSNHLEIDRIWVTLIYGTYHGSLEENLLCTPGWQQLVAFSTPQVTLFKTPQIPSNGDH